ncbi:MAG: two-component regulator propeller domain-containing protein [Pyrinomonadaceae bacterium]
MKPFRHILVYLILFLFATVIASGQYRFDSWTTDNGLPQNSVRGIARTPDGYMWFTTLDGLVRFDGLKFTVFNKNNSKGLETNRLFNLRAATDGSLWISTEKNELVILRDGLFTTYSSKIPGGDILGFVQAEDGEIRVEGQKGEYSFHDNQFNLVLENENDGSQKEVRFGGSGTKWTVRPTETTEERDGVIRTYQIENKTVSYYNGSTFEDSQGALWIGDMGRLWRLKDGRATPYVDTTVLPSDTRPHRLWEESDGSIWFATGGFNRNGVGLVRLKNGKSTRFGTENGLTNDRILALFRDREGSIWLATEKGINRLRPSLITSLSVRDGLPNNDVYPILKTRDGSILIGVNGGLSRYRDGKIENSTVKFAKDPTNNVAIQSLAEDQSGRIWIGAVGGLFVMDGERIRDVTGIIGSNPTIWTINAEPDGTIWLGTERDGIIKIKGEQVVERLTTDNGLAGNDVKFIQRTSNGEYWIATYGGLSHLVNGQFQNFTVKDGLPTDSIRTLKFDDDGTIWVGTYDGGLSRFRNGKFFNFNTGNGLFSDGAFSIVEDKTGKFWISSNQGIYSVSRSELNEVADGAKKSITSFGYGKQDGMLNVECNGGRQPSSMTDEDGRIWFPTAEGIAIVDPASLKPNVMPPPVAIESIEIDRKAVSAAEIVRLEASQTQLDIAFTGLSFIKPEQIRFKYKLDGLDEDWIDSGTRRNVSYTRLPPGDYTFTVIAANSDGVWNDIGRSVKISVAAPFYRTIWFRSLIALLAVGIGFAVYAYRVNALKRRNVSQEAFSRQLIESQEAERKRIAQEIHDGLGQSLLVIKNRAALGLAAAEKMKADEQFDEIRESVTDALSEVRAISQNLRPLHLERLGLTSTLEEMIEQLDAASAIEINYDIEQIDGKLTPENEINLYRIVQESLNNVIKHSDATKASVSVFIESERLVLTIRDNGKGFDRDRVAGRSGLGLNGIAERARILGGTLSIESEPGKGTTVLVNLSV